MHVSRALLAVALLAAGAGLVVWLAGAAPAGGPSTLTLYLLLAAAGVGAIPAVANRVSRGLDRVRQTFPAARGRVTACVWLAATVYLAGTAYFHARDLFPRIHDEQSYMIGAHMLARGRLWMAAHPLADFFDTFHVLVRPVYTSIYFPGTALLNVFGVWLGLPTWIVPVLAAGGVVAITYRVTAELIDDPAGLLAALMVVSVVRFRTLSTMIMSQVPAALLGMLLVLGWLRWRKQRRPAGAMLIGACAGWAAITRPADALAFALPVALAMAIDLWNAKPPPSDRQKTPLRQWVLTAGAVAIGAAPFLATQIVFNLGVTGRALKTPYVLYLEQNQPGSVFGSVPGAPLATSGTTPHPVGSAQKQIYLQWLVEEEQAHRQVGRWHWVSNRLALSALNALPGNGILALLPVGLLGLGRQRWGVAGALPLFFAIYLFNPFFLSHYAVPMVPAAAFLAAAGTHVIAASARSPRLRNIAVSATTLAVLVACTRSLPELNPDIKDEAYTLPTVSLTQGPLGQALQTPAVLLFRFHAGLSPHDEPVYNSNVAWPDDAPIVKTHDLGARNVELFDYYGSRQPARHFYLFDRGDNALYDLGTAEQARRLEPHPPLMIFGPVGPAGDTK